MWGLFGLFAAYLLIEALRTGEIKGRYSTHRRDRDPGAYWFGIIALAVFSAYLLLRAAGIV